MASLCALPAELLVATVEYVSSEYIASLSTGSQLTAAQLPSRVDLQSLCLACRKLRDIATPALYESMTLSTASLRSLSDCVLSQDNVGLKHVRALTVLEKGEQFSEKKHAEALCRLLRALPPHKLKTFEYSYS